LLKCLDLFFAIPSPLPCPPSEKEKPAATSLEYT